MKEVYPVFLKQDESGGYLVSIPDFHSFTEGSDLANAITMARDAIGSVGLAYEDDGEEIPKPFSSVHEAEEGEFETLIDIDFANYRAALDNRLVKKNCTIPYSLEKKATEMGLNFSRVLVEALQEKLGMA